LNISRHHYFDFTRKKKAVGFNPPDGRERRRKGKDEK